MSAIVLAVGAFVAGDRGDRSMIARLQVALQHGIELRTSAIVIAEVRAGSGGYQAEPGRLLPAVDMRLVD